MGWLSRTWSKDLIIDPNAEGIDLVARSSGIVIERTRGGETIVLTSVTGFSAQRGDSLSLSFPVQNRVFHQVYLQYGN